MNAAKKPETARYRIRVASGLSRKVLYEIPVRVKKNFSEKPGGIM